MKKKFQAVTAALATLTIVQVSAAAPESTDPIVVIENHWSSQKVLARVTQRLLANIGYNVELVALGTRDQFAALASGAAHIQMEIWEGSMNKSFTRELAAGRVVDAGSHTAKTREEWWYPSYVEEVCPGLPSWEAINGCAEELSTPDTAPSARYLSGPADWHPEDVERVEALGLDVTITSAKSAKALFDALKSAAANKEPIILFNWAPNWVGAEYPGKFVEFPLRDNYNKCVADPEWGINPNMPNDCGATINGYLKKALWSGFEAKYPCAKQLITKIDFTAPMIESAGALVAVDGLDYDAAAAKWIELNQSVVVGWIPNCAG